MEKLQDIVQEALDYVESEKNKVEDDILLDNKSLDDCLKNQIRLQLHWERVSVYVGGLYEEVKGEVEGAYAEAYRRLMVEDDRDWSTTDAKILVQSDEEYRKHKKAEIELQAAKREAEGILKTVESRKYILKNLVDSVINSTEKYII